MNFVKRILSSFWTWLIIIIVISALAFGASKLREKAKESNTQTIRVVPQTPYAFVTKGRVDVEGGLIDVSARVGGTYKEILAYEGTKVKAGQVLAVMEDDAERIALRNAQASYASALINIDQAKLKLKIDERELKRTQVQREQDAVPGLLLDRAADAVERARFALKVQETALVRVKTSVETARFKLEQRNIRAPVDGYIIKSEVRPGVSASTNAVSTAFLLMPDTERIVRVSLTEAGYVKVFVGQQVVLVSTSNAKERHVGTVARIAQVFSSPENTGMFMRGTSPASIDVVISAPDIPLLIGQSVRVMFKKPKE
ncbi:MAG: hypothetical protein L3J04_06625 [Robiginitomaculum sp.]|nr:hypothetical protein [Robiginitomaculum sp.]